MSVLCPPRTGHALGFPDPHSTVGTLAVRRTDAPAAYDALVSRAWNFIPRPPDVLRYAQHNRRRSREREPDKIAFRCRESFRARDRSRKGPVERPAPRKVLNFGRKHNPRRATSVVMMLLRPLRMPAAKYQERLEVDTNTPLVLIQLPRQ